MVHARLGVAEENSGKLVTLVRNQAKVLAEERGLDLVIVDGAPGIGCPVISSVTGTDFAIIATEPTLSGWHDLERVAGLTAHFRIPTGICINKYDLNPAMTDEIEALSGKLGLKVLGRVRYDPDVTRAQIHKLSTVEYSRGEVAEDIRALWRRVHLELG
jgi:MinD superfamily P-loop ATPase